jgi:hypothetical protein
MLITLQVERVVDLVRLRAATRSHTGDDMPGLLDSGFDFAFGQLRGTQKAWPVYRFVVVGREDVPRAA